MAGESSAAFFSYSRRDSEFALRLAEDLKAAGADVWIDQLDIEGGQEFDVAIEQAVTRASRMLLILTPESVQSGKVRNEIAYALDEEKTIIPILCKDCVVPLQLRRVQYIDFRGDYERGLKALTKILRLQQYNPPASSQVIPTGKEIKPLTRRPKKTATKNSNSDTARKISRSTYQTTGNGCELFPLYGITLGETTVEEMESMGFSRSDMINGRTGEPYQYFVVNGINFWYHDEAVVNNIYISKGTPLPQKWRDLGFSWEKSYDSWLSLLSQMGYSIEVEEEPDTEVWQGHDSFTAEVVARTETPLPLCICLCFGYGLGTSASSPKTLHDLDVRRT